MEKKIKLDMKPEELVALASSIALTLSKNFCFEDLCTLKVLFSTIASNLSLIEHQNKNLDAIKKRQKTV